MTTCQPAPRLAMQLWRNRLNEDVAEREGLAMDMHGLHQTHLDRPMRDCTHLVHVPRWWLPVLDSLHTTAAEVLCKKGLAAARHCLDLDQNPPPDFTYFGDIRHLSDTWTCASLGTTQIINPTEKKSYATMYDNMYAPTNGAAPGKPGCAVVSTAGERAGMGQQELPCLRPLLCLALLCLSWVASDLPAVGRYAAAADARHSCAAHAWRDHQPHGLEARRQARTRRGAVRQGRLQLRRSLAERAEEVRAPTRPRRPSTPEFKWVGPIRHRDVASFRDSDDANTKHRSFEFIHTDGSRVYSAADVALLFKGLKVALIGDSLTAQVYRLFGRSLQTLGYGSLMEGPTHRYFYNMTYTDSVEEMLAKRTSTCRRGIREDTWTEDVILNGPFEGATWSYWRGYKLIPGLRERRTDSDYLFTSHLDYIFQEYDVVISNLGIHYGSSEELKHDLTALGKRMEKFHQQPGKAAFFRQNFPQHFFSYDGSGYYPMPANATLKDKSVCHPAPNKTVQLWRNQILEEEADLRKLSMLVNTYMVNLGGAYLHSPAAAGTAAQVTHCWHAAAD
eukprot:SM000299S10847  [mRNA]  locus=s299:2116:12022:- [translate_table: standard]